MEQNNFASGYSPQILNNTIVGSVAVGSQGLVQVFDRGGNNLNNGHGTIYNLGQ